MKSTALFIFRRDLRLEDNTALITACRENAYVLPIFVFDHRQYDTQQNKYFSVPAFRFMLEALAELAQRCPIAFFQGDVADVVDRLLASGRISAVYANEDYTPFARKRDEALEAVCRRRGTDARFYADALLTNPRDIMTKAGTPYKVYTLFYKSASRLPVAKPRPWRQAYTAQLIRVGDVGDANDAHSAIPATMWRLVESVEASPDRAVGGRTNREATRRWRRLPAVAKTYEQTRNTPALASSTSGMSPYLKFGCFSAREVYYKAQASEPFVRELYWRDFYSYIGFHFPHVYGQNFQTTLQHLRWATGKSAKDAFRRWCEGKTGFPLVDAGMRQLNATGWMHNRLRMIVANFLVKDLHVDWRWGEQYFATRLVDYDPASNNGGWQWCAGTGTDVSRYNYRVFNPWIQSAKFDADGEYIRRWIPELAGGRTRDLHRWHEVHGAHTHIEYPAPMVDHAHEKDIALNMYNKK